MRLFASLTPKMTCTCSFHRVLSIRLVWEQLGRIVFLKHLLSWEYTHNFSHCGWFLNWQKVIYLCICSASLLTGLPPSVLCRQLASNTITTIHVLTFWTRNYFFSLAHPVYKMWMIQEPNTIELWNKLHFEEEKTEIIYHV